MQSFISLDMIIHSAAVIAAVIIAAVAATAVAAAIVPYSAVNVLS